MKAINFNSKVNALQAGEFYSFNFNGGDYTINRDGNNYTISNGVSRVTKSIFRSDMRVADAIAIVFHAAGRATSGEVYRADILQDIRADYGPNMYSGVNCPSQGQGLNRRNDAPESWGVGFELEVCERTREALNAMKAFKSNIWQMVTDCSIGYNQRTHHTEYRKNESGSRAEGIEYTSALIDPVHAINPDFYRNFCTQIAGLATSKCNENTGLHCSISRAAFGDAEDDQNESIARLIYLVNWLIPDAIQTAIFGRDINGWAARNRSAEGTTEAILTLSKKAPRILNDTEVRKAFAADLLTGNKCRRGHDYPDERYHRINITNAERVEFRQGKGDINPDRLAIIAQFVITTAKYATAAKLSRMSLKDYYNSIPTSGKYGTLRNIIADHMSE